MQKRYVGLRLYCVHGESKFARLSIRRKACSTNIVYFVQVYTFLRDLYPFFCIYFTLYSTGFIFYKHFQTSFVYPPHLCTVFGTNSALKKAQGEAQEVVFDFGERLYFPKILTSCTTKSARISLEEILLITVRVNKDEPLYTYEYHDTRRKKRIEHNIKLSA